MPLKEINKLIRQGKNEADIRHYYEVNGFSEEKIVEILEYVREKIN